MYRKPIVLKQAGLMEGVYAASGAAETVSSNYVLEQKASWANNRQYTITVTNNSSEEAETVSLLLHYNGNVTSVTCNNSNYSIDVKGDGTIQITAKKYWGNFAAHESITDELYVQGSDDNIALY